MEKIATLIADVTHHVQNNILPDDPQQRKDYMKAFRAELKNDKYFSDVKQEVQNLCKTFPIY